MPSDQAMTTASPFPDSVRDVAYSHSTLQFSLIGYQRCTSTMQVADTNERAEANFGLRAYHDACSMSLALHSLTGCLRAPRSTKGHRAPAVTVPDVSEPWSSLVWVLVRPASERITDLGQSDTDVRAPFAEVAVLIATFPRSASLDVASHSGRADDWIE